MSGLRRLDWQCQVTPRFLAGWANDLESRGLAPRTINTHLQVIRGWYTWLRDLGMMERSPWRSDLLRKVDHGRLYHRNRVGHVRRVLTQAETQAFIAWAWSQSRVRCCAMMLLMVVGLRRREVAEALRQSLWQDAEGLHLTIQGKGNRTRAMLLDHLAVAAIDRMNAERGPGRPPATGPLIANAQGEHHHPDTIGLWVREAGAAIGRPDLTAHEMRRSYATLIRNRGATLEATQLALGHASPATTQKAYDIGDRRWKGGTGLSLPLEQVVA